MRNKIFLIAGALVFAAAAIFVGLQLKSRGLSLAPEPTPAASEQSVETTVGGTFEIRLDANSSTGYTWTLNYDRSLLLPLEKKYKQGNPGVAGAGGTEIFSFKALAAGEGTITFFYVRPWEENTPPLNTKTYQVLVR